MRALVLALTLTLAGCGSVLRLTYNNIDWVALERVDDYVDLGSVQRSELKAGLERLHAMHRREELPKIVQWLRDARVSTATGLSPQELDALLDRALDGYARNAEMLVPIVAQTLASADARQVDFLVARFEERRRKFKRKYLKDTPDEYAEARVERWLGRARDWLGYVTPEQAKILDNVRALPATGYDWLEFTRAEQLGLITALREGQDGEHITRRLRAWWVTLERMQPDLAHRLERSRARWKKVMLELEATLEPEQRAKLLEHLDRYIDALAPIAEPNARAAANRSVVRYSTTNESIVAASIASQSTSTPSSGLAGA